jgi:hypothetical protein
MKLFSTIVLLALAAFPLSGRAQEAAWQKFHSPEGRFSALFPGKVKEEVTTISTPAGPVTFHFYSVEQQQGFYGVGYSDYSVDPVAARGLDSVLNITRDAAVANVKGKLLSEQPVDIQGHHGREVTILTHNGTASLKARFFMVGSRMYELMAGSSTRMFITGDLDRFFGSFTLDPPLSDSELKSALESLGYNPTRNRQGEYALLLRFNDSRSQTIYVGTDTSSLYGEVVTMWAFVYKTEGNLTDSVRARLFDAVSMKDIGAFYTIRGDQGGTTVIFAARINAASEATRLQKGIVMLGTVADEMEKELAGTDRF